MRPTTPTSTRTGPTLARLLIVADAMLWVALLATFIVLSGGWDTVVTDQARLAMPYWPATLWLAPPVAIGILLFTRDPKLSPLVRAGMGAVIAIYLAVAAGRAVQTSQTLSGELLAAVIEEPGGQQIVFIGRLQTQATPPRATGPIASATPGIRLQTLTRADLISQNGHAWLDNDPLDGQVLEKLTLSPDRSTWTASLHTLLALLAVHWLLAGVWAVVHTSRPVSRGTLFPDPAIFCTLIFFFQIVAWNLLRPG